MWGKLLDQQERERVTLIVQFVTAVALLVGALVTWNQLRATNVQLQLQSKQVEENRQLALKGQFYDRYSDALARFTEGDASARLAGALELHALVTGSGRPVTDRDVQSSVDESVLGAQAGDRRDVAIAAKHALLVSLQKNYPSEPEREADELLRRKIVELLLSMHRFEGVHEPLVLERAKLRGVSLNDLDLTDTNFDEADLSQVSFNGATLRRARFTRARLDGAIFDYALDAFDVNFAEAFGESITFRYLLLSQADFQRACFIGADFSGATLQAATFTEAAIVNSVLPASVRSSHFPSLLLTGTVVGGSAGQQNTGLSVFGLPKDLPAIRRLGEDLLPNVVSQKRLKELIAERCTQS